MAELANLKHEQFCQARVSGKSGAEAYRLAYGSNVGGADQAASRLQKRPEAKARIDELRKELAERNELDRDQIVQDYQAVYEKGMEHPERGGLAAAHQAKSGQAKILGYTTGKEKKPVDEMTDDEFVEQVRVSSPYGPRLANLYAEVFRLGLAESMGKDIEADLGRIEAALRIAVTSGPGNGKGETPGPPIGA